MVELTVEVGHNISRSDSEARKDIYYCLPKLTKLFGHYRAVEEMLL